MPLRSRLNAALARQLGHPSGPAGRLVAWYLNRVNLAMIEGAVQALPSVSGMTVADVGFGGGRGLQRLLQRSGVVTVHGIELSGTTIAVARRQYAAELESGRLQIHEASMTALPLADASLDGLITVNTIYFVADLASALQEMRRTLKDGGRAVVGIRDPEAMQKLPFTERGFRLRPLAEIAAAIQSADLTLVEHRRVTEDERAAHLLVTTPAR